MLMPLEQSATETSRFWLASGHVESVQRTLTLRPFPNCQSIPENAFGLRKTDDRPSTAGNPSPEIRSWSTTLLVAGTPPLGVACSWSRVDRARCRGGARPCRRGGGDARPCRCRAVAGPAEIRKVNSATFAAPDQVGLYVATASCLCMGAGVFCVRLHARGENHGPGSPPARALATPESCPRECRFLSICGSEKRTPVFGPRAWPTPPAR